MTTNAPDDESKTNHMVHAARRAAAGAQRASEDREPSLGRRLGQIGVLGWTIVMPALLGVLTGRLLDRLLSTHVLFSAALLMLGAACGLWFAWRWMHRQQRSTHD
ncbi:MAG: AtpZ/AtpI family protein [Trinickia sp.]